MRWYHGFIRPQRGRIFCGENDHMLPDYQQYIDQLASQTTLNTEAQKRLGRVVEYIPQGSLVTIEGPPIYLSQSWDVDHEFGYNHVLSYLTGELSDTAQQIWHAVLLDDYSDSPRFSPNEYLTSMRIPYTGIVFESEFIDSAQQELTRLREKRHMLFINGATYLSWQNRTDAILRTKSGRIGCVLLDALFQQSKGPGWHIVVHPRMFREQQEQMRTVFQTFDNTPYPFHFINIFTRGNNISQILHTDSQGKTKEV